ncbi:ABC transporter substrate-binding protein (plasmid) [Paracoccus methylovorus]|uniref:ABC transporter substrate-binding protein n=2 Tax=Paracoccus TaxID=265 RepID=A0ABX7JR66_9RHOB|nr:ABC transporter substrate-binding protein [Paracoccus methylovorus]QRZ16154.1 ABC transporter substrate-binding protein [Paracoccus methylovorus]
MKLVEGSKAIPKTNLHRRRFLNLSAAGLGALALSGLDGFSSALSAQANEEELVIAMRRLGFLVPNPLRESGGCMEYLPLLYDRLVAPNPDGTLSTERGVAESWDMSEDGKIWTFRIRKGVTFHDGVELTAEDVKFSMEAAIGPSSRSSRAAEMQETLDTIEVPDPNTLIVRCTRPFLDLVSFYSNRSGVIMPKQYYEKVGDDAFTDHPVGSGPYRFVSVTTGSEIRLEATENHWRDGTPRFKRVTLKMIPEEATGIAMLMTGAADITTVGRDKVDDMRQAGLKIIQKTNAAIMNFRPNMQWTSPAFSDIRFRKALNLAVDKDSVMANIFEGEARPTTTWPGSVINVLGEVPVLTPYPYDPDEAKWLLKDAGFEDYKFKVPSYQRPLAPEFPMLVEAVVGYWQAVGLQPVIYNTDFTVFQADWRAGKVEGNIMGTDGVTDPSPYDILDAMKLYMHSSSGRTIIKDPKLDEILDKASSSLDQAEINGLLIAAYQRIYDQYYFIPLCEVNEIIATTQRTPDWTPGQLSEEHLFYDLTRQA